MLGSLAGFAGALMAQEALRLLGGERGTYAGRLLVYEARPARTRIVSVRLRASCPACGGGKHFESSVPELCEVDRSKRAGGRS